MIQSKEYWYMLLERLAVPDAPLLEVELSDNYKHISIDEKNYLFRDFLKYVSSSNLSKLLDSGFSYAEVVLMRKGVFSENTAIRLKVPVEYGGDYSFDNLYILNRCPTEAIFDEFDSIQMKEFKKDSDKKFPKKFFTIHPEGNIFVPVFISNSLGGDEKNDRVDEEIANINNSLSGRG